MGFRWRLSFRIPALSLVLAELILPGWISARTKQPSLAQAFPSEKCSLVRFGGEVSAGQNLRKALGGDLEFRLTASQDPAISGWLIEIVPMNFPSDEPPDYIHVVTPPFRFWNPRYLDTSYGLSAKEAVARAEREFLFVTKQEDHEKASRALERVLWPRDRKDSEEGSRLLEEVPAAKGRLRILDAKLGGTKKPGDRGRIEWIKFDAVFCMPCSVGSDSRSDAVEADRSRCNSADEAKP